LSELGKLLVGFGVLLIVVGGLLMLVGGAGGKIPWAGRLPGDLYIRRGDWSLYFPITTSILVSLLLTLALSLFFRR